MTADQKDNLSRYRMLVLVLAVASLGALIPFGIASYKYDRCSESLQASLDTLQTKIDAAKGAIEKK